LAADLEPRRGRDVDGNYRHEGDQHQRLVPRAELPTMPSAGLARASRFRSAERLPAASRDA
jgi:hypothetical protein